MIFRAATAAVALIFDMTFEHYPLDKTANVRGPL